MNSTTILLSDITHDRIIGNGYIIRSVKKTPPAVLAGLVATDIIFRDGHIATPSKIYPTHTVRWIGVANYLVLNQADIRATYTINATVIPVENVMLNI